MKKITIIIMIITILSKIFGFTRDIALSYFYGASNVSDAYIIATTIPTVIFSFIGSGIATGYIPMYSRIEDSKGNGDADIYTSNLINILIIISTIIFIFAFLFTEQLVRMFASGFVGDTLLLAIKFTKISILGIYFTGIVSILNGFLQIKGNYIVPSLVGIPMNLLTILFIILSSKGNIMLLAIGTVISIFSQLLLVYPFARRKGYKHKFIFDLKDENMKQMAIIAIPVIIGVSINQINTLIDRTLASNIAIGGISALNYANKLNLFIHGIFVMSLTSVMYPKISKMVAQNDIDGLRKSISEVITSINFLVIPATVGAIIFAQPIVKLLFGRGSFDAEAIQLTSNALLFYSLGMIGLALREVLSRAFYSLQDTKTPMVNASISLLINIILNVILSKYMGIGGLALATSVSAIICTSLLFNGLTKKIGRLDYKKIIISLIKTIIASMFMGIICINVYNITLVRFDENISLIFAIIIGFLLYLIIAYLLKIEEVNINLLKKVY